MPSDAPATTPEFEARAEWVHRVLGIELTGRDGANAVTAEAVVSRFERVDGVHDDILDKLTPYPGWHEATVIKQEHAAQASELVKIKTELTATDAVLVTKAPDLGRRLDAVEKWHADLAARTEALKTEQARLRQMHATVRSQIEATARPHRGEIRSRLDQLEIDLDTAVLANIERGGVQAAAARIAGFEERLTEQQAAIAGQFDTMQQARAALQNRLNGLAPFSESEDEAELTKKRDAVDAALSDNDLEGARKALAEVNNDLDKLERERAEARDGVVRLAGIIGRGSLLGMTSSNPYRGFATRAR